ncbi:MAG TPA: alpha/beta hydrolase [Candidatus Limnocylindrales bacterium]
MNQATSKDGTTIAYHGQGEGPAVILVTGGLDDGSENAPLADALASGFTVLNYQRRGRGESGDNQPYAVEREIEDIDVLIGAVGGGPAHVFGVSSGGALALEAAAAGLAIDRLAVYEVPYLMADELRQFWLSYVEDLREAIAEDRRGDALKLFMSLAGSPPEQIVEAEASEHWPRLLPVAHTLVYDAECLRDGRPPAHLARITQPVLVATGSADWQGDFYAGAADAIAAIVPDARRETIAGQGHVAEPEILAAVLRSFFMA